MFKTIKNLIWLGSFFSLMLVVGNAQAATFSLQPSSGNLIRGCASQITVKMNTESVSSNGAQIYVSHSSVAGGSINIKGAGLYSTYSVPPGVPANTLGLFGYGNIVNGGSLNFATITVTPNANGVFNLSISHNAGDITSKIAAHPTSENILTSVLNGSYIVVDGYCETQPPYITNLDPVADKPNHPVNQSIKFDLRDDGSGLNMSTLNITVQQSGVNLPININQTAKDSNDKWYSIEVVPVNNLTPELKVVVNVSAQDKAGNLMNRTYQFNDLSCAQLGCPTVETIIPQCRDGVDNDGDGRIDFPEDTGCSGPDDNNEFSFSDFDYCGDGVTPCMDLVVPQCSDGIDNDGDGLIDMADSGCEHPLDNNEYIIGEPVVIDDTEQDFPVVEIGGVQFGLSNINFYLANRTVPVWPNNQGVVETLSGVSLTLATDISKINEQISSISVTVGNNKYDFHYDNGLRMFAVDILNVGPIGLNNALLNIVYGDNEQISVPFAFQVNSKGSVVTIDEQKTIVPIIGAVIKLEQWSNGKYVEVASSRADAQGNYGFVVPNGEYRLVFEATGYRTERTSGFRVTNNIINRSTQLISSVDIFDPNISAGEKISYVASVAQEQAIKIVDSINDPQVENVAQNTMAPIASLAAVVATVPPLATLNLLSYLRFLFLQPILLFGRKKRKKWGIVYNALNKLPIDLAVVRLYDVKSNRLIQSRVTDSEGRYAFFVDPGLYRIDVNKPGFIFPTKILQGLKEDTNILDLYHGEPIHVDEQYAAISANIPLDPVGITEKTPRRIKISQMLRSLQRFIASLSIAAGILAVVIKPTWWTIGLLLFQIVLYFLFKKIATPPKPKNWGIVYDKENNQPVEKVVARLFSKQFNKLVATGITDSKGRYSFMVGPNEYYVTFEKMGYQKNISPEILIKNKNEIVKVDIPLVKGSDVQGKMNSEKNLSNGNSLNSDQSFN